MSAPTQTSGEGTRVLYIAGEYKQQELVYKQQSTDSEIECLKQEVYALRLELRRATHPKLWIPHHLPHQIPPGEHFLATIRHTPTRLQAVSQSISEWLWTWKRNACLDLHVPCEGSF